MFAASESPSPSRHNRQALGGVGPSSEYRIGGHLWARTGIAMMAPDLGHRPLAPGGALPACDPFLRPRSFAAAPALGSARSAGEITDATARFHSRNGRRSGVAACGAGAAG